MSAQPELVTIHIDGKPLQVPKGMNLVEAIKLAGTEIPHYCYHPSLSIAGNCRMCQIEIEGAPKLTIACNTTAAEGMKIKTQHTSEAVVQAQRATLEFLLINHPLDCTVCDQAGHCKLQDYYYEYDGKASRFTEQKQHKVKAEPLGPEVIYDGERCIVCSRCVRFCDEITKTSELGIYNRGDRAVVAISPEKPLENPLSGCVVDLCPVGALTHRRWRFNTRIWYSDIINTSCTGCSTGCSARVAVRDGSVVHVKGRMNTAVNDEWLCDEGRYGFERFQPSERLTSFLVSGGERFDSVSEAVALQRTAQLAGANDNDAAVFLSPMLTLEEMWLATKFAQQVMGVQPSSERLAIQLRTRNLTSTQSVLMSPDYAPNARGAEFLGVMKSGARWREELQERYEQLLLRVASGTVKRILVVGDFAILGEDARESVLRGIAASAVSVALVSRAGLAFGIGNQERAKLDGVLAPFRVLCPVRTSIEKDGVFVNGEGHLQRQRKLIQAPFNTLTEWQVLQRIAKACKKEILSQTVIDDRSVFRAMVAEVPALSGLTLAQIGELGISLTQRGEGASAGSAKGSTGVTA